MELNQELLKKYITEYKKYIKSKDYKEEKNQREENQKNYSAWTKTKLAKMTKEEFKEYIKNMWASMFWTNSPEYIANKILSDNSFEDIKKNLIDLLYGEDDISERWDRFKVKWMKIAYKSELLSYNAPQEYIIANSTSYSCLYHLGFKKFGEKFKELSAKQYLEFCEFGKIIKEQMEKQGIKDVNLLTVDEMLYDIVSPKLKQNDDEIINIDEDKYGNFLYYGAPGCGKSYNVKEIAKTFNGGYERVLFHQEYSYSDFIGQILPTVKENKSITYEFKPGPFTQILGDALANKDKQYCLVIEEINRGNAAAIFGDIFQLMDRRKKDNKEIRDENGYRVGDSEYEIKNDLILNWLLNPKANGKRTEKIKENMRKDNKIYIPHNLSIYATMNSSDQNVFVLDTAFKRRWKLRYVPIDLEQIDKNLKIPVGNNEKTVSWKRFIEVLNDIIPELNNGINGEDKLIGQRFVSNEELENIEDFAHKMFLYLWNDVAKVDRTKLFRKNYNYKGKEFKINTLERLIEAYKTIGLNVFIDDIKEKMLNIGEN